MTIIRPITDLRNTNAISELCHQSKDPVFITKNGYGDMVIMSMDTYETMTSQLRTLAAAPAALGFALPQMETAMSQSAAAPLRQAAASPPPAAPLQELSAANFSGDGEKEEATGEEDFGGLRAIREKYRKTKNGPAAL